MKERDSVIFTSLDSLEFHTAVPGQRDILELESSPSGLIFLSFITREWQVFGANDESQFTGCSGHKGLCDFQVCEEAGRSRHPARGQPHSDLGDAWRQLLPTDLRRPPQTTSRRLPRFYFAAFSEFPQGGCLDITHTGSLS